MVRASETHKRKFPDINDLPSASEGSKDYAAIYMDLYFCLRKRTSEAFILSRIYDRTKDYLTILDYNGPKDPKNLTEPDMRKLSIRGAVASDVDGCWRYGWVQFADKYWTKHLPLTEGQISRAVLALKDMGLIETSNSRGTIRAPKGIRLVRIVPEVFNLAAYHCIETKVSERDTWGSGRMEHNRAKTDVVRYDFWTQIKSGRLVEITSGHLPKDLEPLPDHVPDPKAPGAKKRAEKQDSVVTAPCSSQDSVVTAPCSSQDSVVTAPCSSQDLDGLYPTEPNSPESWELHNRVPKTSPCGYQRPHHAVTKDSTIESLRTLPWGDKEHSDEQSYDHDLGTDVGSAILQSRLNENSSNGLSFVSGEVKPEYPGQKETEPTQAKASGEEKESAPPSEDPHLAEAIAGNHLTPNEYMERFEPDYLPYRTTWTTPEGVTFNFLDELVMDYIDYTDPGYQEIANIKVACKTARKDHKLYDRQGKLK